VVKSLWSGWATGCLILWRFARPHTIYGTSASVVGLYGLASPGIPVALGQLPLLGGALLACLAMNIYIVGLNQLMDVEIDRINKPWLPIAAGDLTVRQGWGIIGVCGSVGILLSWIQIPYLVLTVGLSALIGTAYSLPPLRLKRFPFMAALSITVVRGWIVNLGLFAAFQQAMTGSVRLEGSILALVVFITIFGIVISVFKDIPDMEGDRRFQIATFSLQWGALPVLNAAVGILVGSYLILGILGSLLLPQVNVGILSSTHLAAAGILGYYRHRLSSKDPQAIMEYYFLIWRLFYAEYLLYPLAFI